MPELRNLDVQWLSLVDRAAVRDPSDPDQPQRFLLWKRESGEPEPEPNLADLQALVAKTTKAIKKMSKRIDDLATSEGEPLPPDAGGPTAEEAEMTKNETKTAEELSQQLSDLSKSEAGLSAAQETYKKIGAAYLEQLSPAAYAAWRRGQESIGGVAYPGAPMLKADTPALDTDTVKAQAIELQKADPSLSPYDAMLKAMQQDKSGQAAYLREMRGR